MNIPLEPDSNVIVLSEVINKYRADKCQHRQLIIDQDLNDVECASCHAKLNPISMLARFANEQTLWFNRGQQYQKYIKELNELDHQLAHKHRCKCEHCGKMTKIDRTLRSVK